MGLFGVSQYDSDVERATNENNTSEQWGLILDICDKASKSSEDAKNYLRAIFKRLNNSDPHIAIQAATVLDACVSNCGKVFHTEVASRTFEEEYCKLLKKCHIHVAQKLKESLKKWAEGEFKNDPQLNLIPSLYTKLKNAGVDFNTEMPAKKTVTISKDPNVVQSQEEEDQIAKAIELSLKETSSSPKSSTGNSSSLYPTNLASSGLGMPVSSTTGGAAAAAAPVKEARKVRALYDFEAAEDNELTFSAGEIILITDDSDANWWKGSNQRGEGLFPANFVTSDLSVEPEHLIIEKAKKMAQTPDTNPKEEKEPEEIEINEEKVDRLLHLLHEADPTTADHDSVEMLKLEREVIGMGPLVDAELERVDRKHAQLTQLSSDLVEALGLYHSLMRDPQIPVVNKMPYGYPHSTQPPTSVMYNGTMTSSAGMPQYAGPYTFHPGHAGQERQFMQGHPSMMQLPPGLPPPRQMPPGSLPPPHVMMQNLTGPPSSNFGQQPHSIPNYGPQSVPPGFAANSVPPSTQLGAPNTTASQTGHYSAPNGHVM